MLGWAGPYDQCLFRGICIHDKSHYLHLILGLNCDTMSYSGSKLCVHIPWRRYHASNAQPHWITQMMLTKEEPYNAKRLLLSTGITNHYMESNWEDSDYSAGDFY